MVPVICNRQPPLAQAPYLSGCPIRLVAVLPHEPPCREKIRDLDLADMHYAATSPMSSSSLIRQTMPRGQYRQLLCTDTGDTGA